MTPTKPAASVSSYEVERRVRNAAKRKGLISDALRLVAHHDRDAYTFSYPGYGSTTITGLELLQNGIDAVIEHKLDEMLRKPVI